MINNLGNIIYITAVIILVSGLFIIITSDSFFRKIIGLGLFQTSVLVFYVSFGKVANGLPPVLVCLEYSACPMKYSNPLPHVLMLTAIVVGFTTMSVGLALVVKIKNTFGTDLESVIDKELA